MVAGMERFRHHFRGLGESFVVIGGVACDSCMSRSGLAFRTTKDLDLVLVAELVSTRFVDRLREFVKVGRYEVRQRQETGKKEFYRFARPKERDFPFLIELFSRAPAGIEIGPGQAIVPVPVEDSVASLSAILMSDEYYELVRAMSEDHGGMPVAGVGALIPLKARAWLDLRRRRMEGGNVDEHDIRKHRNDVFRLALTLPGEAGPPVPAGVRDDLIRFLNEIPDGSEEWPAIVQALRETVRGGLLPTPAEIRGAISAFFLL